MSTSLKILRVLVCLIFSREVVITFPVLCVSVARQPWKILRRFGICHTYMKNLNLLNCTGLITLSEFLIDYYMKDNERPCRHWREKCGSSERRIQHPWIASGGCSPTGMFPEKHAPGSQG